MADSDTDAEPTPDTVDCRSTEGINIGLIDGIIAAARVLRSRLTGTAAEREALADLQQDDDVRWLLTGRQKVTVTSISPPEPPPRIIPVPVVWPMRERP